MPRAEEARPYLRRDPDARVLIVSLRDYVATPSRGVIYEFEDALVEFENADLIASPRPIGRSVAAQRSIARLARVFPAAQKMQPLPSVQLSRDYEILLFSCENLTDLYFLGPVSRWRKHCRILVCWLNELWAHAIPKRGGEMELLSQFDFVFMTCEGSVAAAASRMSSVVSHAAPAIDALRFCPPRDAPERFIDVYYMGRRTPAIHAALLERARRRNLLYMFDTTTVRALLDVVEHRQLLASLIQRTKFFIVGKAKVNVSGHTQGQEEIGYRFFEGASAGAVLLGGIPNCEAFPSCFDWEDAVIPLEPDGSDADAIIDALEAQPERVARVRRANIVQALERHDWLHRWEMILNTLGLPHSKGMAARKLELDQRADDHRAPPADRKDAHDMDAMNRQIG